MSLRNFVKPVRSQVLKGLSTKSGLPFGTIESHRHLSTNPHRVNETWDFPKAVVRTNVPSTASVDFPITASPAYDIKESPLDFKLSVKIPEGLEAGNLVVDIEQGSKGLRITGDSPDAEGNYFSKRFTWGGIMDERLQATMEHGHFVVQAPKIHYLNGNSFLHG